MATKSKRNPKRSLAQHGDAPASKNPVFDMLNNIDPETLQSLQHLFFDEISKSAGGQIGAAIMFEDYLTDCALGEIDDSEQNERLAELVKVLDKLRIDANGGDRRAREEIKEINALLAQATKRSDFDPVNAIMIGKVFADAGWPIPEVLKRFLAASFSALAPRGAPLEAPDFMATVYELSANVDHNPFDLHEQLNSLIAVFPTDMVETLLSQIVASRDSLATQAAAGFILHPDIAVARTTARALAASAARAPVESVQVERLVRMRQWTPPDRSDFLDSAIRDMRTNEAAPVPAPPAKILHCGASVCDGAGVRSLFFSQKVGSKYVVGTAMLKPEGVADAMLLTHLGKSQMVAIVESLCGAAPTARMEPAAIARLIRLAVAENIACGVLPPFKLVELAEAFGLGPLPLETTPMHDLVAELLADLPSDQTDAAACERAQSALAESEFADNWFEAGEDLDALLAPIKAKKQREKKILNEFLPRRRAFWTRQCALSALTLRDDNPSPDAHWKLLALAGRDLASEKPLDSMPLMRRIAKSTAEAYTASL